MDVGGIVYPLFNKPWALHMVRTGAELLPCRDWRACLLWSEKLRYETRDGMQ